VVYTGAAAGLVVVVVADEDLVLWGELAWVAVGAAVGCCCGAGMGAWAGVVILLVVPVLWAWWEAW
jgi:hypothetical protein